ncbi:beta-L-arabinofuranosidase domain-containing protein [Caulobacter hibisci]|uniref:Glycoside hydrolase family 127 protein n=1 Tax=Caulobacter hibisci TaxID=2035993 RepID=A0ABS0SVW6_9CAUL|nr:glycoside hydrolase family 127 protein [Caulobacter hibisci]MBI1683785.1 glycoside hydrolase family 127 protein [Caulobacter hibisci]
MSASRRDLLLATAAVMATAQPLRALAAGKGPVVPAKAKPLPLNDVRLRPSDFATAVEVNHAYLLRLSPDRLLHNFMIFAGLPAKGEIYGGWESDTIAGHTLGHYLTALVLTWQQTGDEECRRRADYIVSELARAQAKRGTGYVGALQRKRKDGTVVDGEEIFGEVMKGDIRSGGFDLNGSWSPLYTVHKLFAGLLDVNGAWGNPQALQVVTGLGAYFEKVFAALDDAQMQTLLGCEYGGLNESYAELYARTKDARWLVVAERIYDRKVLDPLAAQEDKLANFHANTQVPKLIGLGRLYELTGKEKDATAARFFWQTVTQHHSYVIGGNADREYFSSPDSIADHITEQTCEHCNTYNMLKLTRQLYSWKPDGALFDYYERAHLNHVMAAQNPKTGGFTYMTPLMTGSTRGFSTTDDDAFWCCVGSGMESHAKHGESIFWEGEGTLLVNLYIPADAQWKARGAALKLESLYPFEPESRLTLSKLAKPGRFTIALRVPAWAAGKAVVSVNDSAVTPVLSGGYALVERQWKAGDVVSIALPLELRVEATPGDPNTVAFLRGPMVLAADLGAAESEWNSADPAMVGDDLLAGFKPVEVKKALYAVDGVSRPGALAFAPFYSQYERRSAVYFKRFTEASWKTEEAAFLADQAKARDIAARSVDVMHLGEMQPERDHNLTSDISYPVSYRGRNGRDARSGGFFEFDMKVRAGALILQATYWGGERSRTFDILVDGTKVATQVLDNDRAGKFFDVEYPLAEALTKGKTSVKVRFVPKERSSAGPVFGVRVFSAKAGATA